MRSAFTKSTLVSLFSVLAVVVASCGGAEAEPSVATGSTTTSTLDQTTTTAPALEWTVVAIGDSTPAGFGVAAEDRYPRVYADLLADDLGAEVRAANHATGQTRSVSEWVEIVQTDETLIADLSEADVVLVWLGWHDILPIVYLRSAMSWPDPIRPELLAKNDELAEAWPALIAMLRRTAPPDATILVADTGLPSPIVEKYGDEPFWPELEQLVFLDWRDVLIGSAAEHGAVVVPTWEAMTEAEGETDPQLDFASEDGLHLNEAGHRFLAELHREHDGLTP